MTRSMSDVGASSSAGTATSASTCVKKDGSAFTIAFVPGTTGDPFYITMHSGVVARAKELGVNLIYQGNADWDVAKQVPLLDSLLVRKPDALLLVPNDVKVLEPSVKHFVDAGIPVITVHNTIEDATLLTGRVTSNNEQGGALAADQLAKLAGKTGKVALIDVGPGNSTTDARAKGFMDELKKYPNMQLVAHEYNQNSATKAAAQTSSILLGNPDLVGIFGDNLASAEGAANGVASSGSKVPAVGYDASPSEVKLLKAGTIDALVIQPPAEEGTTAMDIACAALTGKTFNKEVVLKNVIATSDNMNDPEISKYFYIEAFNG